MSIYKTKKEALRHSSLLFLSSSVLEKDKKTGSAYVCVCVCAPCSHTGRGERCQKLSALRKVTLCLESLFGAAR